MNKQIYLVFLLIGFLFTSCDKSNIEYENSFKKSEKVWLSFKSENDNSYRYTVNGSSWVGISWQTTLTITNGKVTQRHFKYTHVIDDYELDIPTEELEWTESEEELNSHENGAATITLDEVYETAKNVWLKKRDGASISFEANNNGLISSAGFVEDGCQDDCFVGINISRIESL